MKSLISVVPFVVCLGLTLSPLVADAYKFNKPGKKISTSDEWDDWNWEMQSPAGNSKRLKYQVTRVTGPKHPVKEGNTALRFEARYGDCGWNAGGPKECHTEDAGVFTYAGIWHKDKMHDGADALAQEGKTAWYSWDTFIPEGKKYQPTSEVMLEEWHHNGNAPSGGGCDPSIQVDWTYSGKRKSHVITISNNAITPTIDDDWNHDPEKAKLKTINIPSGRWINFKWQIRWTRKKSGWFKFWLDGKRVLTFKGRTMLPETECGNIFLATGIIGIVDKGDRPVIYKDNFRAGLTQAQMQTSYHPFWQDSGCRTKSLIVNCRMVEKPYGTRGIWPGYVGKDKNTGPVITRPKGGEPWKKGKRYLIKWSKGDAGKYVKLELYRREKRYRTITKKTRNDGAFKWKIPASVLKGDKYQVRVTSTSIKKRYYLSDGFFTIK